MTENTYIAEIKNEYRRIDEKWLNLHYKTSVGLVFFALFIECIMALVLYQMGEIHTTIPIYLLKYLVIPTAINIICLLAGFKALQSSVISQNVKIYIVSVLFVFICFILFAVHSIFSALYLIFAAPIVLTTVYGNYILTTTTAFFSIAADIISEIFVNWDPDKLDIFEDDTRLANFIISQFILMAFYVVCMIVIQFEREKNAASLLKEKERYQLQQKIQFDELTGINNRTALQESFHNIEEDNMENYYILAIVDLDNFKILNDTLGHIQGDECLIEFGRILKSNCKDAIPFRYGGDEFCILFKNWTLQHAMEICEKIKEELLNYKLMKNMEAPLSVSFGLAVHSKEMSTARLFINADTALYQSKLKKNTIKVFEGDM